MGVSSRPGATPAAGVDRRALFVLVLLVLALTGFAPPAPQKDTPGAISVSVAAAGVAGEAQQTNTPGVVRESPEHADARAWCAAAARHAAGAFDAPAFEIAPWPLQRLEVALGTLLALIKDAQKAVRALPVEKRAAFAERDDSVAWLGLTAAELMDGDATRLVKRGALLHTDIALLAEGRLRDPHRAVPRTRRPSISVSDGQLKGYETESDHWDFARALLDRVRPAPQRDPAVGTWYRAVAAHLVNEGSYGELSRHLDAGRELLPGDPVLAMMDGVKHQALASPRIQAAMSVVVLPPGATFAVGSREAELRRARDAFEDAVKLDPGLVEARILLGRVLADQGSPADAVRMLRGAIVSNDEPGWQYIAALFRGEQEMSLGQTLDARASFEQAAALFPRAQSPLLALSELARMQGDRAATLEALSRLTRLPARADLSEDPWWTFLRLPGSQASAWLNDARARLADGATP